jgi:hypothetical protein
MSAKLHSIVKYPAPTVPASLSLPETSSKPLSFLNRVVLHRLEKSLPVQFGCADNLAHLKPFSFPFFKFTILATDRLRISERISTGEPQHVGLSNEVLEDQIYALLLCL